MEIIVVGAGACGLMAAKCLAEKGHQIIVVEAKDRIGGRIHTMTTGFSIPIEAGAEFIHGNQATTNSILNAANRKTTLLSGERYQLWTDKIENDDFFEDGWDALMKKLRRLEHDMDMASFLDKHFSGEKYAALRLKVKGFVEGYDAADMHRVSALALSKEWSESDDEHQYHIDGGYSGLIEYLAACVEHAGGKIILDSPVSDLHWNKGKVKVITPGGEFNAEKAIVTIPLGALQNNSVTFVPDIPRHQEAFDSMGFGGVAKFFFEFRSPFWEDRVSRALRDVAFIFSDAEVPTWWSQRPLLTPLLTGWVGGPATSRLPDSSDYLYKKAINSLQYIFRCSRQEIEGEILQWYAVNWIHDPHTYGAYAYPTVNTHKALGFLKQSLKDAVYFAGEAMYEGAAIGTVEAALENGRDVAERI